MPVATASPRCIRAVSPADGIESELHVAGSTVPNAVIAKVGAGGRVCVFVSQRAHLVVDVNGFFPVSTSYRPGNPSRVLETRPARHDSVTGCSRVVVR